RPECVTGQPVSDVVLAIGGFKRGSQPGGLLTLVPDRVDGCQLNVAEPQAGQFPRRAFLRVDQRDERPGRTRRSRNRIVELVRESGRQSAQRLQTLVVELYGPEFPGTIQHLMHERRSEFRMV